MALTILKYPDNTASVTNEMLFIIQESTKAVDPVTYPNYKYVLDVYVDSVLVQRMKTVPDPTHSLGVFDVSTILRDYVPAYGLKADYSNDTETYDVKLSYLVKLGEEYSDTLYTNLVTDSTRTTYKTYAKRSFLSSDIITGKLGDCASNMPMSPSKLTAYKDAKWMLYPLIDNASGTNVITCELSSNGTIVGGGTVDFDYPTADKMMQVNIGFEKLATALSLTNSEKQSVDLLIVSTSAGNATHFKYACTKYPIVTMAWLNPYGAYESQSFGLVSKKTNQISRKEYARLPYTFNASGVVSYDSAGVMLGSKKTYASKISPSLALTSHILTDEEYTWLADLFNSTDVYVFDSDLDRFIPVTITDNNYELRTYANSRFTPLQFTVQFTDDYNAQYL